LYSKYKAPKEDKIKTDRPKTVQIFTRISEELKEEFQDVLIKNDEKQSDVIRSFIKQYIKENK
jgi:antitoxin component of RelBE/YafQ-DinJ toxin-antitoxin module